MKNSAKQFVKQYIKEARQYIDGNVSEHLILNVQSEDQGYQGYLTDEEIDEYENASSERRQEIRQEIESFLSDNFNYDITEFSYYNA